jgi:uncharacterized protein (DUF486 family)
LYEENEDIIRLAIWYKNNSQADFKYNLEDCMDRISKVITVLGMDRISKIITVLGVVCFGWFIVFFIKYGWGINQVNASMGIIGSIFIVGGLILMQLSKKEA